MIVNSQLVCLPPAGILNLVMFIHYYLFTLVLKSPITCIYNYVCIHIHIIVVAVCVVVVGICFSFLFINLILSWRIFKARIKGAPLRGMMYSI